MRSVLFRGANILISALLIMLVAAFFYKDYASLFRNNKELVKSLSPSNSIVATSSWYSHQRLAHLPLVRIGEDAHRNPLMVKEKRKNLTIVVLGETSRGDNFSLSGYSRQTNPLLEKDDVVYFPVPHPAERQRQYLSPACSRVCHARTTMKNWRSIRKACSTLFSGRELTFCGTITTAAAKGHATGYRTRI